MSFLDVILNVNVSTAGAAPTGANFGTPAGFAYHTHFSDKRRIYFDVSDMPADGFTLFEPSYLIATAMCEQNPHASTFMMIRGTTAVSQVMTLTVNDHQQGDGVGITLLGPDGNSHALYHTNTNSDTNITVGTALATLIGAVAGLTATSAAGILTVTSTVPGAMFYPQARSGLTYLDATPSASVAVDLTATRAIEQGFYSVTSQYIDATNIAQIATWCEANDVFNAYSTSDDNNFTATTGIGATLMGESLNMSVGHWVGQPGQFLPAGLCAQRFTDDPGSDSWAYKTVIGATPDNLTATQIAGLRANNLNFYIGEDNLPMTFEGKCASGMYADLQRGLDAMRSDMQIRMYTVQKANKKLPYTQAGLAVLGSCVSDSLNAFIKTGFVSNDAGEKYTVTVPDVTLVSAALKASRVAPPIKFSFVTQGAIHQASVQGSANF